MRILYILNQIPLQTETFISNEIDNLQNNNLDFQICLIGNDISPNIPFFKKFINNIFILPRLPENILLKILILMYFHLKVFLYHPFNYIKVLRWLIFHYDVGYLKCFHYLAKMVSFLDFYKPDIYYCRYPTE